MDADTVNLKLETHERLDQQRWETMQQDVDEIKSEIKQLPDEIASRINGYTDLKIAFEIQKLKSSFYKWISGLSFVCLGQLIMLLFEIFSGTKA